MTSDGRFLGADLIFEPSAHSYALPDGRRVPSVTTILQATGIAVNYGALGATSRTTDFYIAAARLLGRTVHADCHAFDDGDLVWNTVDPRVLPYLEAWGIFRANAGLRPIARERRVYHATLGYCGTLDGIFEDTRGRRILIDIKTGDPNDSGCRYQTAAYQLAWLTEHAEQIDERWAVQLDPDRTVPYRVTRYDDWTDFQAWAAIVATYRAQARRD